MMTSTFNKLNAYAFRSTLSLNIESSYGGAIIARGDKESVTLGVYDQPKDNVYTLMYQIYADKKGYKTKVFKDSEFMWSSACLTNLSYRFAYATLIDGESKKALAKFTGLKVDELQAFINYQYKIMTGKRESKYQKEINNTINAMGKIPSIPADFYDWIYDNALLDDNYLYYEPIRKKEVSAYCDHCQTDFKMIKPKRFERGVCPKCELGVKYIPNTITSTKTDNFWATLVQPSEDGRMLYRHFLVYRKHEKEFRQPVQTKITESFRIFVNGKSKDIYSYGAYKNSGLLAWKLDPPSYYAPTFWGVLYHKNIQDLINAFPKYKYSALATLASSKPNFCFDVRHYLASYLKYPQLEYLVKLGLCNLTAQLSYEYILHDGKYIEDKLNLKAKNPKDLLELDSHNLKLLQVLNGDIIILDILRQAQKRGRVLKAEQVRLLLDKIRGCARYQVAGIVGYSSVEKTLNYIKKQLVVYKNKSTLIWYERADIDRITHRIISDWRDYLFMCGDLGRDIKNEFVLFPKNLYEAHELIIIDYARMKDEIKNKKIEALTDTLNVLYAFNYNDLFIRAPRNAKEIQNEGDCLHHCVASYIDRMGNGETSILFMRKKDNPEKPYITLEVKDNRLVQYQGLHNKLPSNDDERENVLNCIKAFEKSKLSKESVCKSLRLA